FAGFHTVVPYPGQRRHHATCKPPHHIPGRRLCQGTPGDKLMSGRLAEVPPRTPCPKQMPRTAETLTTTTKEANSRFLTDCYLEDAAFRPHRRRGSPRDRRRSKPLNKAGGSARTTEFLRTNKVLQTKHSSTESVLQTRRAPAD